MTFLEPKFIAGIWCSEMASRNRSGVHPIILAALGMLKNSAVSRDNLGIRQD